MASAGATVNPTMLSSRCALLSCLIFGICIFQYYSAAVVGALISEKPKTLKTLRQLADSSLKLSVEDIAYNRDYLIVIFSTLYTQHKVREMLESIINSKYVPFCCLEHKRSNRTGNVPQEDSNG